MRRRGMGGTLAALVAVFGLAVPVSSAQAAPVTASSLTWVGGSGDLVAGYDANWNVPNGVTDGVFQLTLVSSGKNQLTSLGLMNQTGGGAWNTGSKPDLTGYVWALGVTKSLKSRLLNASDARINISFTNKIVLYLHADGYSSYFNPGDTFDLDVNNGDLPTLHATIPSS